MTAGASTDPVRDTLAGWRNNQRVRSLVRAVGLVSTPIVIILLAIALYRGISTGDYGLLLGVVMAVIALAALIAVGLIAAISMSRRKDGGISIVNLSTAPTTGTLQTMSRTVAMGNARSIRAQIEMKVGALDVSGDVASASSAVEAQFRYDDADWKPPELRYVLDTTGQANLTVHQAGTGRFAAHQGPNEWQIRLNNRLPTDLSVKIGAGDADLRLSGLPLTALNVTGGVGAVTVDLTGDWQNSLIAFITGGIGSVTVRLPQTIGVRVETSVTLGDIRPGTLVRDGDAYVNTLYGKTPVTLTLRVEGGMGQISLE